MKDDAQNGGKLAASLEELRETVERLPKEYDLFFHPGKHLLFTYMKGIVYGLGAITAVAIVVPLIVWLLKGIDWVPIIGDFVGQIAQQVQEARRP